MVGFSKMHMSLSFQQSPISQWNKETVSVCQQGIIGNPSRNSLKSLAFVPSPGDYCQRGKLKTTPCQKVIESSPSKKDIHFRLRHLFFLFPVFQGLWQLHVTRCGRYVRATAMAVAAAGRRFCFALRGYGGGGDATCNEES